MFRFDGQVCDICGKPFDKDSDVVVCPECGTPHHRECWHELGHCVNEYRHGEGYEWAPVVKEVPQGSIECPDCHSIMPQGTLFCENCGRALKTEDPNTQVYNIPGGRMEVHQFPNAYTMDPNEFKARVDRELAGEIDGVPLRDMAVFIGQNAQYYIYKFKRMRKDPKYKPFNWTACMFPPIWFLFRKLWKQAIVAAIINFVLNLPTFFIVAAQSGVLSTSSPLLFPGIEAAATITSLLVIVVGIVWGFLAEPMYKNDTVKRLKKLKADAGENTDRYYRSILEQAGPSKVGKAVMVLFVIYYIFTIFTL